MQRDPSVFLQDVLDATDSIKTFLTGLSELDFAESELVQSAVYYQFAIVGEALNNFAKTSPGQAVHIVDLQKIVSFRNILTHAYHRVSPGLVYSYAIDSLPSLETSVRSLLDGTMRSPIFNK